MNDFSNTPITELTALIAEHLQSHGIEVVLVGGLAVEIYTDNLYLTKDIDMVNTNYSAPKAIHRAMAELGFHKRGRVYENDTTDITVEFPPGPLSVGDQLIKETTQQTVANKSVPILTVRDVVKDRLAAYIHWQDRQSLIQAATILIKHQRDPVEFKAFCEHEGTSADYGLFQDLYRRARKQNILDMAQLEHLLAEILLENI